MSEPQPKQEILPPQQIGIPIPPISLKDVEGFAKVWRKGGPNGSIICILDQTAKEFARDFSTVVAKALVPYVTGQVIKALQAKSVQAQQSAPTPPAKGLITLTD
jgi:hypothetical protein